MELSNIQSTNKNEMLDLYRNNLNSSNNNIAQNQPAKMEKRADSVEISQQASMTLARQENTPPPTPPTDNATYNYAGKIGG